jgi:transmembrane sensor
MNMSSPNPILLEAAAWHARLHGQGLVPRDTLAEHERWLRGDVARRLAYADVCAAAFAAEQFEGDVLRPAPLPVLRLRSRARAWVAGVALGCAVMAIAWQGQRPLDRLRSDVHTAEAEVREIELEDGSKVWLGADSALAYQFDADGRELRLLRGEAFFDVQPDKSRPFRVVAGEVTATALGTRYAVSHRGAARVDVQVEEGTVEVRRDGSDPVRVQAGQQVSVEARVGEVRTLAAAELDWRRGLLVFDEAPAHEVVARLDAYIPGRVVLLSREGDARISAAITAADARPSLLAIAAREGWRADGIPGLVLVLH